MFSLFIVTNALVWVFHFKDFLGLCLETKENGVEIGWPKVCTNL